MENIEKWKQNEYKLMGILCKILFNNVEWNQKLD